MTKANNNLTIAEQLNTPKTETRIILNDWQVEAKTSKLSVAARNKVINRSGNNYISPWADTDIGETTGYGPCSYSGCPYSTDFNLSINIEGDRWWGRPFNEYFWSETNWSWGNSCMWTVVTLKSDLLQYWNDLLEHATN